jgi:hypothetical protein
MGRNVPKEDVPKPRGGLKAACLGDQAHHVASQPFCPDTASEEYTDWVSAPHLIEARPTDLAHLLLADQISIWLLTNFLKNVV